MRRLTSILTSLAVAAGAVSISSSAALAAGGTLTKKTSATVAPSSVPNAEVIRFTRLPKSNSVIAIGYNKQATGARLNLWKIKEDLTLDTSFGAVDLGADLALPTPSNSSCVAQNQGVCWWATPLSVNETTDRYVFSLNRQLNSTINSNLSSYITTIVIGKLSTGEILAKVSDFQNLDSNADAAGWATYGATKFSSGICTSLWGQTFQSISLASSSVNTYATLMRADGSIAMNLSCNYSNMNGSNSSTHVKEYETSAIVGLKASGSTIVLDTSWGTNGVLKTFEDPTKCGDWFPASTPDSSITSNSAKKIYSTAQVTISSRTSTYPYGGGVQPASYDGCGNGITNSQNAVTKLFVFEADGSVMATNTLSVGTNTFINRWIIDPKGNWNTVVTSGMGQNPTTQLIRLNPKGELDTTLGAGGTKTLTGLPSSVTVNGTSVAMRYSLSGIAVTSTGYYFTGFSTTGMSNCNNQNYTSKIYPYYMSPESGLITSYGTSGLGEALTLEMNNSNSCIGSASLSFINSKGQHGYIAQVPAIGSQAAGLVGATWDAAEGVTSGGEGVGTVGSANRVDKKVYSTKLPTTVQTDSALQVITAKQAEDLDIRTSTPKICVALTTSVLLVNPGRCVVRIIDEDTKKVLRTMTTTVKATDVDAGTTLTTDEPIYFKQANVKLSKTALAQVKELAAAAATASRIVVIGHSAALGDVSQYSYAISRNRAEAVKAALIKAGVKKPIEVVALAYNQPEKTAKTEKAQAKNRRAEVFIFP